MKEKDINKLGLLLYGNVAFGLIMVGLAVSGIISFITAIVLVIAFAVFALVYGNLQMKKDIAPIYIAVIEENGHKFYCKNLDHPKVKGAQIIEMLPEDYAALPATMESQKFFE